MKTKIASVLVVLGIGVFVYATLQEDDFLDVVILDSDTSVRASKHQSVVSPDQGWAAIRARVLSNTAAENGREIWINNLAWRYNGFDWARWNLETGEGYRILAERDGQLSTWTEADVYNIRRVFYRNRPHQRNFWRTN